MDFTELVTDLDHGRTHQQLSELLAHIIDGVQVHGTAGELVLKLGIKKVGDRAVVTPTITSKVPHEPVAETMFWFAREGGALTRDNERQLQLRDLRPQAVREVGHG